ncbi:unnamed protein product [Spirodela intermedia]|uniref:Uncharacterized protein n=1 Tax=Spirodela intermedia TaxID=51605 RepID=A0A7I8IBY5_SPIIN|nr:unnamed protein product [Spirodela intermedia]CAA6655328.1 unnamed protein product [Spirodela intermedia]
MKITILDTFLVHYILQTLPVEYDLFKVSYNIHKDEWSMNDLMTKCVQEEERQVTSQLDKINTMNMVTYGSKNRASKGKMIKKSLEKNHKLGVTKSSISKVVKTYKDGQIR